MARSGLLFVLDGDRDVTGMTQSCVGRVDTSESGLSHSEREIDVGVSDRRVHRIESAEANEILAPHGKTGRGERSHVTQRLRQIKMLGGVRLALMERCSGQPAHSHHQAGVLDFPSLIKHFRRDRAHLRILQGLDQILNPLRPLGFDIVIEKNQSFSRGRLGAEIAFVGKVKRFVVRHETHRRVLRLETLERFEQLAVRHDHDLKIRIFVQRGRSRRHLCARVGESVGTIRRRHAAR